MGIKVARNKERNIKLSVIYKLQKLPFFPSSEKRLRFYLDLAWIFGRLAHEQTFQTKIGNQVKTENFFLRRKIPVNANILDIGCGYGYVISDLLDITKNITGIDYDSTSIENAKKRIQAKEVSLFCIDVFEYLKDNPEKKFDIIILSHLIEHIDNPEVFLKKLSTKAPLIYIEVPDFEATHLNLYRQAVHSNLNYTDADHVTEFDRKDLMEMISQAGLLVFAEEYRFGLMKFWCKVKP